MRNSNPNRLTLVPEPVESETVSISCDECSMRATTACNDCVVTFVLGSGDESPLVLDLDQARAVRLLGNAGLIPDLKFQDTG